MRYGILGDIHGNLEALETVIAELRRAGAEAFLSVGDVVGYGADPSACIQCLRDIGAAVVAGNHDWAVTGRLDASFFNLFAREAVEWTRSVLPAEDLAWLEALPLTRVIDDQITVAHATLDRPGAFDYIVSDEDALPGLALQATPVAFVGHSHVPRNFILDGTLTVNESASVTVPDDARALINVGSIGQPRDMNPHATFALYDSGARIFTRRRLRYDILGTAAKIRRAGLPPILADRLRFGR